MTEISRYVNYLPPTLWFQDSDPTQFLGRMLRIFEKILTGIPIDASVVRERALFVNASGTKIVLHNSVNATKFRPKDIVTIQGQPERAEIDHITGSEIILATALAGTYGVGTVRLADLEPGQDHFRLDNKKNLGEDIPIKIQQSTTSETVVIDQVEGEFIWLRSGLTQTYLMSYTDVPIRIQDGQPLIHGTHQHVAIQELIENRHLLFSSWRTRDDYLPWLASWVALPLRSDWSEYQTRKLISEMVGIYQLRGLKQGLQTYLDIYVVTEAKPRIAIDDGEALFRAVVSDNGRMQLRAVAHSQTLALPGGPVNVLLHPTGLAVDNNNNYIVADEGNVALTPPRPPALWKISSSGKVDYATGPPPRPRPIHSGNPLNLPKAVVVDNQNRYSVVDIGTITSSNSLKSGIYRFAPPAYTLTRVIDQVIDPSHAVTLPAVHPVDMVLDASGHFVILDRGLHPLGDPPAGASDPHIVVVREGPLAAAPHALAQVVEPTAIAMDSVGRFIVADAKDQYSADPVDLVRVDPNAGWSETSLLAGMASNQNPLVFPTGLAFEDLDTLLVCDTGLRWGYNTLDPEGSDPAYRYLAEPAAIYRIDLSPLSQVPPKAPKITRVTPDRQLVNPSKMMFDRRGNLTIADQGEALRSSPQRDWRSQTNEFGVIVHFSRQRSTTFAVRNQIRRGIVTVAEEQKPGHSSWWMDF